MLGNFHRFTIYRDPGSPSENGKPWNLKKNNAFEGGDEVHPINSSSDKVSQDSLGI